MSGSLTGRVVLVTGTSTDIGKTIATAALVATAVGSVVMVKPAQTGVAEGLPGDADVVAALTGVETQVWTRLDEPLAPDVAARRQGVGIPPVVHYAARIAALTASYDVVVVEGAGGLLVRLDADGGTLLDLAVLLDSALPGALEVVVVVGLQLGTLNHTELTVAALRSRGIAPSGLVIGSLPSELGLAEACNRDDLPRVAGLPVLASIPVGAGQLSRAEFIAQAPTWMTDPATG